MAIGERITSPEGSAAGGTARRIITELVTIRLSAAQTGDAITLLEIESPPGGGIPPHTHRYEDETVFVLQGSYTLLAGEQQEDLGPGDARFFARGTRHGYVNSGTGLARLLVHLSPGGIHEQFLDEIADLAARPMWESDLARIVTLAPAYGIEFDSADE